ncbi:MAG TPA: hypothetical protein VE669_03290 [Actinomycetota bacterium]|jgi:hypothetical protein|nr:hypothetical protein [Actinomycetota bacterium]
MSRFAPLILAMTLGLAAGACGDGDGSAGPTLTPTAPSATGEPSPTPTGELTSPASPPISPTLEPPPPLEDGRHFGFIKRVDVRNRVIVFDLAEFLTGDEANEAAAEHGDETPVPNDYYIVNDNPRLRTLPLSPDLRLRLIDWNHCCDLSLDGDLEVFARAIAEGEPVADGSALYYGAWSPYWLEVEDGAVVMIEEQYLP